jgi:DNA-binding SARP family transcriptional activator
MTGPASRSGPVVLVLGPIEIVGAPRPLTSQQRSLVAYLACVGPGGRERIIDALWDGRPVSGRRFANLLSEVRAALGREHLPDAVGGRYRLVGIETDLDRFERLVAPSGRMHRERAPAPRGEVEVETAEVQALEAALALVRGTALGAPGGRHWAWLDQHPELTARTEAAVAEVACRLAALHRAGGDLERARRACERGLACSPLDRSLVTTLETVYLDQGRPGVARRLARSWEARTARIDGVPPDRVAS